MDQIADLPKVFISHFFNILPISSLSLELPLMIQFSFKLCQIHFVKNSIDLHANGGSSILCCAFFSSSAKIARATFIHARFHLPVKSSERFQLVHVLIRYRRGVTISSILTHNLFQTLRTVGYVEMTTPTPSANEK